MRLKKTKNRKVSEKYVLKTPWLALRKDGYKNKNGRVDDYYIVERPDYVVIVPRTKDKKFILVQQYRHGVGSMILNFPMGFIDKGEKPHETARRELAEETGSVAKNIKLIGAFFLAPAFLKTKGHVFFANDIVRRSKREAFDQREHLKIKLVSEARLENLIQKGQLSDLSSIAAYLMVKSKKLLQ